MLLSIFCPITSTKDPQTAKLISRHWLDNSQSLTQSDTVYILSTMSILAPYIEKNTKEQIITDLMMRIKAYNQPACVIKYLVVATLQVIIVYKRFYSGVAVQAVVYCDYHIPVRLLRGIHISI